MDPRRETQRLLKWLRFLIQISGQAQQEIEQRSNFSSGHLSQILNGRVDLKLQHVLRILEAIDVSPAELFFQVFPRRRSRVPEVLEGFRQRSQGFERELILDLARLYGYGIESLEDFETRLEKCEDVLAGLTGQGVLDQKS